MSKKMIIILIFVLIGALLLAFSTEDRQGNFMGQLNDQKFAQTALENYVNYVLDERTVTNFGFKDLKEAKSAKVGDPISVYYIPLKHLKEYRPETPATKLFIDPTKLFFPVHVDGEVRTKIEIIQMEGEWVAGEFGGLVFVHLLEDALQKLPGILKEHTISKSKTPVLVHVPALQASLLYIDAGDQEYFMTVTIYPERYRLEDGQLYKAELLLEIFSEYAQKIEEGIVD